MSPKRIQRKRIKDWRMPEGAVYVGRPTMWANPWRVGSTGWFVEPGGRINRDPHPPLTAEQAVESYRNSVTHDPDEMALIRHELAGLDLVCWCPHQPCHADVLLSIAAGGDGSCPPPST